MNVDTAISTSTRLANEIGHDPIEDRLGETIRTAIEAVCEQELAQFLGGLPPWAS